MNQKSTSLKRAMKCVIRIMRRSKHTTVLTNENRWNSDFLLCVCRLLWAREREHVVKLSIIRDVEHAISFVRVRWMSTKKSAPFYVISLYVCDSVCNTVAHIFLLLFTSVCCVYLCVFVCILILVWDRRVYVTHLFYYSYSRLLIFLVRRALISQLLYGGQNTRNTTKNFLFTQKLNEFSEWSNGNRCDKIAIPTANQVIKDDPNGMISIFCIAYNRSIIELFRTRANIKYTLNIIFGVFSLLMVLVWLGLRFEHFVINFHILIIRDEMRFAARMRCEFLFSDAFPR